MNILPKKRWHVRTKDNIARVRRDEAQAAEEEREKLRRAKLAEQEARTALLRQRARAGRTDSDEEQTEDIVKATPAVHDSQASSDEGQPPKKAPPKKKVDAFSRVQQTSATTADIYTKEGNINFFKELESGGPGTTGSLTNKEHEAEEKAEKEKYEKQIGLLTYLGQDSLEASKATEWYNDEDKYVSAMWSKAAKNKKADAEDEEDGKTAENLEIGLKYKKLQDPLTDVIKYTGWKPTKSCPASGSNVLFSSTSNNRMIEHGAVSSTNTSMLAISDGKCDRKLKKMLRKKKKLDRKIKEHGSNLKRSSKKSKKHKREKRNDDHRDKSQLRRRNKSRSTESSSKMSSRKDLQERDSNHETSSKRKRKRSSTESDDQPSRTNHEISSKRKRKRSSSSSNSDDRPSRKKRRSKSSKRSRSSSDSSHASSNSSYTTDSEAERQDKEERHKQLEKLRAERLAREAEERKRAQRLLAGLDPNVEPPPAPVPGAARQKYSAQFNPLVARQNKEPLRAGVKYF